MNPASVRQRVDFPHPDGPVMTTTSPAAICSVTSSSAGRSRSGNRTVSRSRRIAVRLLDDKLRHPLHPMGAVVGRRHELEPSVIEGHEERGVLLHGG